ncbi:hypothetical protein Peur_025084 [Populus x canadensis]
MEVYCGRSCWRGFLAVEGSWRPIVTITIGGSGILMLVVGQHDCSIMRQPFTTSVDLPVIFQPQAQSNCVTRTSIDLERRDPLPQVTSVDLSIPHPLYLPRRCTTSSKPKLIHKVKYVSDPVEM